MKKIAINPILARKVWLTFGVVLLLTMLPFFQGFFGPLLYLEARHFPAYQFAFGRYFLFVLSIVCFFVTYHQEGKKNIFTLSCSIMLLIIWIISTLMNVKLVWLIILFSFVFSFLPLAFYVYASLNIHRKYFSSIFLGLVTLCAGFEAYWMKRGWHYGVKFQGLDFIHHSIVRNIIFFLSIYILIGIYYKSRNIAFLHAAILLFCVTISVVAFPWLGESM